LGRQYGNTQRSKNKHLAYKFINFILRPEIAAKISDYLMIPSPVTDAVKYQQRKPLYNVEELSNCEIL
jgi:spermidine/putrescine transport system substrate-binding protein